MLHEEKQYPTVAPHIPPNSQMEMLSSLISEETDAVIEFSLVGRPFNASFLTIVADWDMDQVCTRCLFYLFLTLFTCIPTEFICVQRISSVSPNPILYVLIILCLIICGFLFCLL